MIAVPELEKRIAPTSDAIIDLQERCGLHL
jgi:hypothetical protein